MKKLKFADDLPEKVLSGTKNSTWRVNDDKDISSGDELSLCRIDGNEFATAKVIFVKETTFGELSEQDWEGHEKFSSEKEMYSTYSKYYDFKVFPETELKIIKFKLDK
ncbi:ASCH domain-containing protein [Candidatus Woesearchaeota archaeon]|nr:ASCH domain-containing protein [Candidatus Woesearchaeota archaeon]